MSEIVDTVSELFGYNRKGYMFDQKLRQEREYQEQDMRVKQFLLYREDVRDLAELTAGKMDCYIMMALIELGSCIILLVEGVLKEYVNPNPDPLRDHGKFETPDWLLWLYVVSLAEAFLYLFLSVWFAIHASVSAHSFSVRLLTQFVRLPLPDKVHLDAARGYAADFEAGGVDGLLRVPVWRQQMDRLRAESADGQTERAGNDVASAMAAIDPWAPSSVSALSHVKVYRKLQAHWQAHDAYARACLSLGTYAMVHALGYFIIGLLVIEHASPWSALGCLMILLVLVYLLVVLDLYFKRFAFALVTLLIMTGPLLTLLAVTLGRSDLPSGIREIERFIVPIIFTLHAALTLSVSYVAQAEHTADRSVALPTRFRAVLYLDVFGWIGDPAAPSVSPQPDNARTNSARCSLNAQQRHGLISKCRELEQTIQRELHAWDSSSARRHIDRMPQVGTEVRRLHAELRELRPLVALETNRFSSTPLPTIQSQSSMHFESSSSVAGAPSEQPLWLRLRLDGTCTISSPSTPELDYYVDGAGTTKMGQVPQGEHISDLRILDQSLKELRTKVTTLGQDAGPTAARPTGLARIFRRTSREPQSAEVRHFSSPPTAPSRAQTAPPSSLAQVSQYGGAEAIPEHVLGADAFGTTAAAVQTFYPRVDGPVINQRPPGQVPRKTFCYGSAVLASVWLSGFVYFSLAVIFRFDKESLVEMHSQLSHQDDLLSASIPGVQLQLNNVGSEMPVRPVALACRSGYDAGKNVNLTDSRSYNTRALGALKKDVSVADPSLLIVERYAVLEFPIEALSTMDTGEKLSALTQLERHRDVDACLTGAPQFHAKGLTGLQLECSRRRAASAVLIGAETSAGRRSLRCPLQGPCNKVASSALSKAPEWSFLAGKQWIDACEAGGKVYALHRPKDSRSRARLGESAAEVWRFDMPEHNTAVE